MTDRPVIVTIGGGSGSGKSTFARAISKALNSKRVLVLNEDNYNHDHGSNPTFVASDFNFDHIEAHDHALLSAHIQQLRDGGQIHQPIYDFVTHRRQSATNLGGPSDIILIEGIHVLYSDAIRFYTDLSVYIDVPDDVRLARRLFRDIVTRGREPLSVMAQYLVTVRPMHYRYTYPGRFVADIVLHDYGNRLVEEDPSSTKEIRLLIAPVLSRIGKLLP
jgi:uridine kinase